MSELIGAIIVFVYLQIRSEIMTVLNHMVHSKETLPEDMCKDPYSLLVPLYLYKVSLLHVAY